MQLILVRHGESIGNFENRLQGQTDYELTPRGRLEAEATAERLAAMGASALYTSPLTRAMGTAVTIAGRLGCEPRVLEELSEYHFGELSGATYAEIRERFGQTTAPQERVYPGEEGRGVFFRRVTETLWRIADEHPGEAVAVVSHGGPIALFCQNVLGLPYRRPMPFSIANASLSLVEVADERSRERGARAVLGRLNDRVICEGSRARAGRPRMGSR